MSIKTINITIDELIDKFKKYNTNEKDIDLIRRAYYYAEKKHFGQKRISGDDYILHPLNVALILTEISADAPCMAAALLHDTIEDSDATKEEIEELFGSEVALLVDGVTKINKINFSSDSEASAAYQRKILVGLSEDVRVIIIKLADRLHNMRTLDVMSEEKQKKKAKETLEILTPVAHRLGIYKIKSELEDLSLRYLKPEAYFDIVEKLNQKKVERDAAVSKMMDEVSSLLKEHNIPHEIKGRSKSIYSIYNKLAKGRPFSDIYDILALRVFVDTEQECYIALGLIHSKYKPVPKRFKDYIAMPKTNLYQSLHTTVFGIDGELFEIQIRTYEMDKIAEYGIASHWSYKEHKDASATSKDVMEQKLQIFRNIIELNEDSTTPEEFVSSVKKDILSNDVIYVYTPKGDVMELPEGSTPVDFAYKVHSEVGDRMIGAIVNDNIVPLDYKLNTGDIIKINTNKASTPSKDWLNFVITTGAKNKIRAYFSRLEKDENIEKGNNLLEKELRKNNLSINEFLTNKNIDIILDNLKLKDIDDLYVNIALGKYTPNQIIKIINKPEEEKVDLTTKINETNYNKTNFSNNDVLVEGMNEIKASLSSCCKPIPGDNIIGYITRGSGITVHRSTCKNIIDIDERLINVKWNNNITKKYPSDILVYTNTFDNLLDIITKASSSGIIIDSISTINKSDYKVYNMTVLVENKEKLEKFMSDLLNLKFVQKVERSVN
ncbi:MAG: RelA/SpoT family protein [Bacilli bacterium]